jgi:hypothetical protein
MWNDRITPSTIKQEEKKIDQLKTTSSRLCPHGPREDRNILMQQNKKVRNGHLLIMKNPSVPLFSHIPPKQEE